MNQFLKETNHVNNGIQKVYGFPNGYGASVIKHDNSYGSKENLWELAVLNGAGELDYSTPITDDVLGRLTWENVYNTLTTIKEL